MPFRKFFPLFLGTLLLLACALPTAVENIAMPTAVPTAIPAIQSTETAEPAQMPTETPANPTQPPSTMSIEHLSAGQEIKVTNIHMLDAAQGWAIGGLDANGDHILRTADGGLTWQDVTPPEPMAASSATQSAIGFFMDLNHAWVAYHGAVPSPAAQASIWRTADGGATWQQATLTDPALFTEGYMPSDLSFVDAQHGWMMVHVGAGMNHDYFVLLASTDDGATWQTLISPQNDASGTQGCYKNALTFVSPQNGWMTVDCHGVVPVPYIFKSDDGGASWQSIQFPAPPSLPDIFDKGYCGPNNPILFTATSGDLVLDCIQYTDNVSTPHPFLYETADAGATWKTWPYPGGTLQFVGASTAFALSRSIQRSDDAGHTWNLVRTVNWDGQFSFIDANSVWAVASADGQIALVKSVDGASTWQEIKPKIAP